MLQNSNLDINRMLIDIGVVCQSSRQSPRRFGICKFIGTEDCRSSFQLRVLASNFSTSCLLYTDTCMDHPIRFCFVVLQMGMKVDGIVLRSPHRQRTFEHIYHFDSANEPLESLPFEYLTYIYRRYVLIQVFLFGFLRWDEDVLLASNPRQW